MAREASKQKFSKRDVDSRQVVTFKLSGEEYGVDIHRVMEIARRGGDEITPVPNVEDYVEGVLNLRGNVIPVVNLTRRFGLVRGNVEGEEDEFAFLNRIRENVLVAEVGGRQVALVVDSVSEVVRIPEDQIEPSPAVISAVDAKYLVGVGKVDGRFIRLLDLDKAMKEVGLEGLKA
ncbi:MAG: chemotaxis protein CheW [bacterium]